MAEHLYVHVPFCSRRCSYCDFAIAVRRTVPVDDFLATLELELRSRTPSDAAAGGPHSLRTLYLGGGTPSKFGASGIERLLLVLREAEGVTLRDDAEVTMECNPEDVTKERAQAWVAAGVNRLSIGAQSFDPGVLTWMHRTHEADAVDRAVDVARESGISNLSLDLIFALPSSLSRDWSDDLRRALALRPQHVSLYGLTAEPRSPFGRWLARGEVDEAPEGRYASEFLEADETLGAAGFEHYEVSNFAQPGLRSLHNSSYWSRAAYLGLGPSAHSYDGLRTRSWNVSEYEQWRGRLVSGTSPVEESEELSDDALAAEQVYLGLRTTTGLRLDAGSARVFERFALAGWGSLERGCATLSPAGWLRLDSIAAALTAAGSR